MKLTRTQKGVQTMTGLAKGFLKIFEEEFPMLQSDETMEFELRMTNQKDSVCEIVSTKLPTEDPSCAVRCTALVLTVSELRGGGVSKFYCTPFFRREDESGRIIFDSFNLTPPDHVFFGMVYDESAKENKFSIISKSKNSSLKRTTVEGLSEYKLERKSPSSKSHLHLGVREISV